MTQTAAMSRENVTESLRPDGQSDAATDRVARPLRGWFDLMEFASSEAANLASPRATYHFPFLMGRALAGGVVMPSPVDVRFFSRFFFPFDAGAAVASLNESALRLTEHAVPKNLEMVLDRMCAVAGDEQFEPGMESRFSLGLEQLFQLNPTAVLSSLKSRLAADEADSEVLAEMLSWAARHEARAVRTPILDLLLTGLKHRSPLVRDAAALGIAYLENVQAITLLKMAAERESVPELREDLEDLARSLAR